MLEESNQKKSGIKIFFLPEKENIFKINELLKEKYFGGSDDPIREDGVLELPFGGYSVGMGSISFYCYRSLPAYENCFLRPAFHFHVGYGLVIWVKDLDHNSLWQNYDYNEDGTPKIK